MKMAITVTKSELTRQVKEKVGSVPHLHIIVNAVFEAVAKNLVEGNDVTITNFGTFKVVEREAREGRNPRTGEEIYIPARNMPVFRASRSFKDRVN